MNLRSVPKFWLYFILIVVALGCMLLGIVFGAFPLLTLQGWNQEVSAEQWKLLISLRAPRVACCVLVGALLACCGVISQSLLRNPLACPYTLGVSQLVALIIFASLFLKLQIFLVILFLIALGLYVLANALRAVKTPEISLQQSLILLGLAVGTFCSSLIVALQFVLDGNSLMQMTRWLMGSLSVVGFTPLIPLGLALIVTFAFAYKKSEELDWFLLGDEFALSRGVDARSLSLLFGVLLLLSVTIVVWSVGPIGFVGLIVPHVARLVGITRHRMLLVVSALLGASFLCLSDVAARTLISPIELPIGVVTGVIGTPIFIWLLVRRIGN